MNEEKLADLLANHLDALQAGDTLPGSPPNEIAELLEVAQLLTDSAPSPRPEFGPALKDSLLGPTSGSNGAAGSSLETNMVFIGLIVLGGLIAVALIVGITFFGILQSDSSEESGSTPEPGLTRTVPAQVIGSPTAPASATLAVPDPTSEAGQPRQTSDTLLVPRLTQTAVIDILPPFTSTLEPAAPIPSPADLSPGQAPPDSGGGDRDGGGRGGDRNRGHGNDPDRHDEDNPGRGRGDDDDD